MAASEVVNAERAAKELGWKPKMPAFEAPEVMAKDIAFVLDGK